MTHYIHPDDYSKKANNIIFTLCGKYWVDAYAITTDPKKVSCKKCIQKLK